MAMRARVELRGSLTHLGAGRLFKKGSPQILTNPAEIKYYQDQAGFAVTMLSVEKAKAKAPVPPPKVEEVEEVLADEEITGEYMESDLRKMKKAELISIAEELSLNAEGTVNELVARILGAQE